MFEDILVILKTLCLKRILVSSVPLLALKKLKGPTLSIKDYASLRSFWNEKKKKTRLDYLALFSLKMVSCTAKRFTYMRQRRKNYVTAQWDIRLQ